MSKERENPSPSKSPHIPGITSGARANRRILTLALDRAGTESQTFRLDKDRVVIGRVVSADVRLTGDGVSPIHAVIEFSGAEGTEEITIYDLASDTGLFVNGTKTVTQALKAGDILTIGAHKLRVGIEKLESMSFRDKIRESEGRKLFINPKEDLASLLLSDERGITEIFDTRQTYKQAVEVVMSWNETILDVGHFVERKAVTIGSLRDCDFTIPPVLSSERFAIVSGAGDNYTLNLDSRMKGVMQRKGELLSLDQLRAANPAGPNGYQISFQKGDFAKISVGELDFYLSFTSAPPRLRATKSMDRDPLFWKIFFSSMVLTGLTIYGLTKVHVSQNVEAEQLPERIATILYQPEKYAYQAPKPPEPLQKAQAVPEQKQPDTPTKLDITPNPSNANKPVPKEMGTGKQTAKGVTGASSKKHASKGQSEAKEGKGARAKGNEGTRGTKKAQADTQHQAEAARPSPQGGNGRGGGDSRVADEGNVDFLKGASGKIQDILGNSAAKLGKGGEKLKGFGGFNTQGNGGLALSGEGKGGGGTAESLGGLSDSGKGGGRVGTGLGATGSGSGFIGGQARVAIHTGGPEEALVMGSIDADAVEAALLAHRDEFRLCYERELNAETPNIAGRVGTNFVIGSTGKVTQAGIESSTLKSPNTERCILQVIRRIDFPIPGGGIVQVTYPFKFSPGGH